MKRTLITYKILILFFCLLFLKGNQLYPNDKYAKWQTPSYFRGYNVLYEAPKTLQDFIDFRNYGGNFFHIQIDGFLDEDPPYDVQQADIDGTDLLVGFCRQAGIHYVIGVRSGPGAYDTFDESQGNTPESRIWNTGNTTEQDLYAQMLTTIIQRYQPDTLFVGINLVIEPRPKVRAIPANRSELYKFFLENIFNIHMDQVYDFWISKIRMVDAGLPIIIENFAYSTPELFPAYEFSDPYIIYSAHDYQPNEFTKAETPFTMIYPGIYWNITFLSQQLYNAQFINETIFGKLRQFQLSTSRPILLGEFGMLLPQNGGPEFINDVLDVCLNNDWHFAIWDWRRRSGQNWNFEAFQEPDNLHWKTALSKFHPPPVPNLISPINGGFAWVNPTFVWDSLTSFTKYDLVINNPLELEPILIEDISNSHYTYTESALTKGLTYTWSVRSKNPGGEEQNWSEWAPLQSFYIPVPDNPETETGNKYALKQNSPNPFNPSTNIHYYLPKQSFVKLVIYDILGREIITLVEQAQQQGSYSVTFNASHLPSGVYIFKLEATHSGGAVFNEVKRMILIK